MILVNKKEAYAIRKQFPSIRIVRTMVAHSDRHRYYVTSERYILEYLSKARNVPIKDLEKL